MRTKTLIQLRDDDFVECLRSAVKRLHKQGIPASPEKIISLAMSARPKRYYLSADTITKNIIRLYRQKTAGSLHANRVCQSQWRDIYDEVNRYMILHAKASLDDAISHIANYGRPSRFFIPPKSARELFRRSIRLEYHIDL